MKPQNNPDVTALGGEEPKPFGGVRIGRRQHDLNDVAQVFMLATEMAEGGARGVKLASTEELMAVAKLCAVAANVVFAASALFARSDEGAGKPEMKLLMLQLADVTRPLMGQRIEAQSESART